MSFFYKKHMKLLFSLFVSPVMTCKHHEGLGIDVNIKIAFNSHWKYKNLPSEIDHAYQCISMKTAFIFKKLHAICHIIKCHLAFWVCKWLKVTLDEKCYRQAIIIKWIWKNNPKLPESISCLDKENDKNWRWIITSVHQH